MFLTLEKESWEASFKTEMEPKITQRRPEKQTIKKKKRMNIDFVIK